MASNTILLNEILSRLTSIEDRMRAVELRLDSNEREFINDDDYDNDELNKSVSNNVKPRGKIISNLPYNNNRVQNSTNNRLHSFHDNVLTSRQLSSTSSTSERPKSATTARRSPGDFNRRLNMSSKEANRNNKSVANSGSERLRPRTAGSKDARNELNGWYSNDDDDVGGFDAGVYNDNGFDDDDDSVMNTNNFKYAPSPPSPKSQKPRQPFPQQSTKSLQLSRSLTRKLTLSNTETNRINSKRSGMVTGRNAVVYRNLKNDFVDGVTINDGIGHLQQQQQQQRQFQNGNAKSLSDRDRSQQSGLNTPRVYDVFRSNASRNKQASSGGSGGERGNGRSRAVIGVYDFNGMSR